MTALDFEEIIKIMLQHQYERVEHSIKAIYKKFPGTLRAVDIAELFRQSEGCYGVKTAQDVQDLIEELKDD